MRVEIVKTTSGYELLRGGAPYRIRGVGMTDGDLAGLAAHGGNSIRNWTTIGGPVPTRELLDQAHAHGITVALGLPMRAERAGFDYDDADAVAAQLETMRAEVLEYRDHPALLFWIIGNELNHEYTNPRVYDAVGDVAKMIRELDPHHPTTTTVAGFGENVIRDIRTRAPALHFISFQTYGTLFELPAQLEASGFDDAFMVTEWGTIGYWEVPTTEWGAPIELTSSRKAAIYLRGYTEVLGTLQGRLIGSYAFYWGQKQERTPTWFGLFTEEGRSTEAIDVLHYIWNGAWPAQRAPELLSLELNGRDAESNVTLETGTIYEAAVEARAVRNEPLSYRWELKPESEATESGGDFEAPISNISRYIDTCNTPGIRLTAPPPGAYRLFVYVYNDHGHAAHANLPFVVTPRD